MFFTQNIGYNSQRPYTCPAGHIIWIFSLGILNLGLGLFALEGFWHAEANGFCLESPEMESSWCNLGFFVFFTFWPDPKVTVLGGVKNSNSGHLSAKPSLEM